MHTTNLHIYSKRKKNTLFCLKSVIKTAFFIAFLAHIANQSYLCIVFFIVLDLRLQRLGQSVDPFFMSLPQESGQMSHKKSRHIITDMPTPQN